jgi:hypothetical protein
MKIAILAWDSLVGDRRQLQAAGDFAPNGPLLPIEFCRVSRDGRLTLVVDETFGAVCTSHSVASGITDLDEAIDNLRLAEGAPNARQIGFVEPASGRRSDIAAERHPQVIEAISAWAAANGYDAAIWGALASNFDEPGRGGEPFSVTAALRYLEALESRDAAGFAAALAYMRKAPIEVETPVREEVDKRWRA